MSIIITSSRYRLELQHLLAKDVREILKFADLARQDDAPEPIKRWGRIFTRTLDLLRTTIGPLESCECIHEASIVDIMNGAHGARWALFDALKRTAKMV